MFKVSTVTEFIMLIIFSLTLNMLHLNSMLLLMVLFLFLSDNQSNNHFMRIMKRLKWVYLFMFVIFLFNTPGEHIVNWGNGLTPTFEGLRLGLEQVLRIALTLAALSVILANNTTQQLISGLYFLLKPLSIFGVDVRRFAARLWLTLHYVEAQEASVEGGNSVMKGLGERLKLAFVEDGTQHIDVELEHESLTWLDYAAIAMMLGFLGAAFMMRGY